VTGPTTRALFDPFKNEFEVSPQGATLHRPSAAGSAMDWRTWRCSATRRDGAARRDP
jgi:hypothetical protein